MGVYFVEWRKRMKRKKGLIIGIVSLIFIILLPLAIDWLIIGNEFPSNIDNSDWVGFFGGCPKILRVIPCISIREKREM